MVSTIGSATRSGIRFKLQMPCPQLLHWQWDIQNFQEGAPLKEGPWSSCCIVSFPSFNKHLEEGRRPLKWTLAAVSVEGRFSEHCRCCNARCRRPLLIGIRALPSSATNACMLPMRPEMTLTGRSRLHSTWRHLQGLLCCRFLAMLRSGMKDGSSSTDHKLCSRWRLPAVGMQASGVLSLLSLTVL